MRENTYDILLSILFHARLHDEPMVRIETDYLEELLKKQTIQKSRYDLFVSGVFMGMALVMVCYAVLK